MEPARDEMQLRWRLDDATRASLLVILAVCVPLAAYLLRSADGIWARLIAVGFLAVIPLAAWLTAFRPYAELRGQLLTVRNPMIRRELPLSSIERMSYSRYGLEIVGSDGKRIVVWVFQGGSPRARRRADEFGLRVGVHPAHDAV